MFASDWEIGYVVLNVILAYFYYKYLIKGIIQKRFQLDGFSLCFALLMSLSLQLIASYIFILATWWVTLAMLWFFNIVDVFYYLFQRAKRNKKHA